MNKKFQEFSEELFNTYLKINPQVGTSLGLHEYDGKTGDVTQNGIVREVVIYKELYEKLRAINREELTDINKYDYDLAKWAIESELFELEDIQSFKNSPRFYISIISGIDSYINREYAPFDERLKSILNIVKEIPGILETAETNLGTSLPAVFCRYAKHSSAGFQNFFESKLLNVIKEKTNDEKLINEYIEKSAEAVKAFKKFSDFIEKVSSDANEDFRLGKDKFLKMIWIKEQINLSLDEIKSLGMEELKRLQNEFNRVISENNFEGKLDELEHSHPSEQNLISETENMLDELVEFVRNNNIVDLPEKLNCIVTEMPKYDDFGFAAMGTAGPFEKSDESYYYVNLPDKEWDDKKKEEWMTQFNYPTLKLVSIHEAYPGHYTHFLNANKNSTKLSKLFTSYSYVEGWAHYSEEMMIDQGYSKDDFKIQIGMLQEALIRCCRYIVAIGIHCENMSINEAKEFFLTNAYMTETTAMNEAERGAFDPGYLNYTLGKIFLKRFKEKYFEKFGKSKSLKDFHNQIVSLGAPTFKIAEDFVFNNS